MNDILLMHISHALHQLVDVVPSFHFVKTLAATQKVGQGLVLADVQHQIDVLRVFEVAIEADNILMRERIVNLNLTCEFLARLSASQVGLRDYLERPSLVFVVVSLNGLDSLDFVALGESSLAEEPPLLILDVTWRLTFRQFTNFLFNNLHRAKLHTRV